MMSSVPTFDELETGALKLMGALRRAERERDEATISAQRWKNRYYELAREMAKLKQEKQQTPATHGVPPEVMQPRPPISRRSARKS
jgi:hypothetical protein